MIRVELLSAPGRTKCRMAKAVVGKLIEQAREIVGELRVDEVEITERPELATSAASSGLARTVTTFADP